MGKVLQSPKNGILDGLSKAMAAYDVMAPVRKGDKFLFDKAENAREVEFSYPGTVLSPKKFFFPKSEVMLEYTPDGKVSAKNEARPTVLFGVRPCDINGIRILDEAFADSKGDPLYLSRREKTVVIGMECAQVCNEHAFCFRVNSNIAEEGYDIMLAPKGDAFMVTVKTPKGEDFAKRFFQTSDADPKALDAFHAEKAKTFARAGVLFKDFDRLPALFEANKAHSVWKEEGDRCLSCGSCIMVCPTCYCFDVADELALSLKKGERIRRWDACMLSEFAVVGSGENFRHDKVNRLKHRIYRKFDYLMTKHGASVCVGCGRCVRACLAKISPKTIVEALNGEKDKASAVAVQAKPQAKRVNAKSADPKLYLPEKVKITAIRDFTPAEKFFRLELLERKSLGHDPGQFVQVSLLGIGEAPISISSPPSADNTFELCVRAIGDVTKAMHALKVGDTFHIRGPFGHGFDSKLLAEFQGKHLVLITGGLGYVPLRSLINPVVKDKAKYKKITIMYGAKTPELRMYIDELDWLRGVGGNVELLEIVEKHDGSWKGAVGMPTKLIPPLEMDPANTSAIICGPPIMYKFVLRELLQKDIKKENIFMSLERRMKCGVGKCGHCQMEGIYVCQEGPVFRYSDVCDNEEVF